MSATCTTLLIGLVVTAAACGPLDEGEADSKPYACRYESKHNTICSSGSVYGEWRPGCYQVRSEAECRELTQGSYHGGTCSSETRYRNVSLASGQCQAAATPPARVGYGGACSASADCAAGNDCLRRKDTGAGYCARSCYDDADCTHPDGNPGVCLELTGGHSCVVLCTAAGGCPSGLTCQQVGGGSACMP